MKEEPKVLTRMRLSCCWGDNLSEKELNEVVDYINNLQSQLKAKDKIIGKIEKYFIKETIKLNKIKEDVSVDYYIDRKAFLEEAITEINKILSKGENK